jgi:hypothetical protein
MYSFHDVLPSATLTSGQAKGITQYWTPHIQGLETIIGQAEKEGEMISLVIL